MTVGGKLFLAVLVLGVLAYFLWYADFLPDISWMGYLDDLGVGLLALKIFTKYVGKPIPGTDKLQNTLKIMPLGGKLIAWALLILLGVYWLHGPDLIPDYMGVIGYLDDFIFGILIFRFISKYIGDPVDTVS